MADLGFLESELAAFPQEQRGALRKILTHLVRDMRFGNPNGEARDPMLNFGGAFLHGRTPTTAHQEFSLEHGFGRAPYLLLPVLRLNVVNATVIPLTVTRIADHRRIYLSSEAAGATFSVAVEGG